MIADRLPDCQPGDLPMSVDALDAETRVLYWRCGDRWMIWLPVAGLGDLSKHDVIEHDDGTLTVSPSILVGQWPGGLRERHGYLERGIWRDV